MFRWFEKRLDPFPPEEPIEPPKTLVAFCVHYTRGAWPFILVDAVLVAAIAIAEVWMFGFLGRIVDWLSAAEPRDLPRHRGLEARRHGLHRRCLCCPARCGSIRCINQQTLMGNYPMRIRWQVHRYLLKQSMTFYQDEFAGRIATKLMQTALAVRECVIKLIDVLNYVIVYFLGMLVIVGSADWRLAAPLVVWLVCYILLLRYFIPRLGKVSEEQADARSMMTGRVVDSYTNIQTVKLFSHARREASYAREGMASFLETVYRSMRLVTTLFGVLYVLNSLLLFSVTALSIWLWLGQAVTIGAVAVVIGLVLRLWGMSQWIMWEVSGAVREHRHGAGRHHVDLDAHGWSRTSPRAKDIVVPHGEIAFDRIGFHYGKGKGVIDNLSLTVQAGREGRAGRPLGRRQVDAGQSAAALLRPRKRPHPDRRPGYRRRHAGFAARQYRHGHAGHLAAAPLGARQHPLRPAGRRRGDGGRGGAAGRGARFHRRRWPIRRAARGSTRMSASAASSCRAASASASRSPASC